MKIYMEKKFVARILLIIVMPILCIGVMIQPKKISAAPASKYVKHYKKAQIKTKKYRNKAYNAYCMAKTKEYLGKAMKVWDNELNYMYKETKKKISKKRFEKLKKSQKKWIKYRDKKAWEAYDKEQGGSIAGVSYIESIIKNTKRRTKWIMDTYL